MACEVSAQFPHVVSATRLHGLPETGDLPEATQEHLRAYVRCARDLGVVCAIAVDKRKETVESIAWKVAPHFEVHVLLVPCWGRFVPALNALLHFAQAMGAEYILYQSLEMKCSPQVLQLILDHHTDDTLVVGPVLDGHIFNPGECKLNGRTTPWNTLALWSVCKLGLTGFLYIADGLPQLDGEPDESDVPTEPRSHAGWWPLGQMQRQISGDDVPAGVEEVTTIALLQHMHGEDRARAALVQLPEELEEQLLWNHSWGNDKKRASWHKEKMESKVRRPAAQLKKLFRLKRTEWKASPGNESAVCESQESKHGALHFGTVMHYGETIPPQPRIQWLCLIACWLFSVNSAAALAAVSAGVPEAAEATRYSAATMAFVYAFATGAYLPMPQSLWVTRWATVFQDAAGLVLCFAFLMLGHLCVVLVELLGCSCMLWMAHVVQGLGTGVPSHVLFMLMSLSTSDQHASLQSWIFLAIDLGLACGTVLPAILSSLTKAEWFDWSRKDTPMLLPSLVLSILNLAYVVWLLLALPRRLPFLSRSLRFSEWVVKAGQVSSKADKGDPYHSQQGEASNEENISKAVLEGSGAVWPFLQSAALTTVAVSLREAHWQILAVVVICLVLVPLETFACQGHFTEPGGSFEMALTLAIAVTGMVRLPAKPGNAMNVVARASELAALMVALARIAPFNAWRSNQVQKAESAIGHLEWVKVYAGRLSGALLALLVRQAVGNHEALAVLCLAIVAAAYAPSAVTLGKLRFHPSVTS